MSHAAFDEETLEALVFERSKRWANTMKHFMEVDDGEEIDLDNIENLFKDEERDPDVQEDEEAVEDDLLEADLDMRNMNTTTAMSKAELTMILCAGENKAETAEIEKILNETMPVVEEHKRKWKAAGLDKILDTFDAQKIEQHVGKWMRRNNSVYMEAESSQRHDSHFDASDNESLHSVDTARYIMQSRRRNAPTSKVTNMTTIKMYRTHPRRRDELRVKYGYDDEQEHRHHMQALLHRRREKERKLAYLASRPRHCSYNGSSSHSRSHHSRLKHLRKRRVASSFFESESSEDEDANLSGCDCRSCLRRVMTRSAYECCSYRGQLEHLHQSASSRSVHCVRRPHSFQEELDLRPRLLENDCSCCNSDQLCADVVHIANSSTEEWVVDNCNSPVHTGTPTKCNNRLQICKNKHLTLRKTSQTVRSKRRERAMPESLHKLTRKATSAVASRREATIQFIKHSIDSDTSDEDAPMKRRRPAISTVENATKRKAIPTKLPSISEIVIRASSEDEANSSDEDAFRNRSRLMSFSEVKQKKLAKNRKAFKTPNKPMSCMEKTPQKRTVRTLPAISEDAATTTDSSSLPETLKEDVAKPAEEVDRLKKLFTEDKMELKETNKAPAQICTNSDADVFNSKKILKTKSSAQISATDAPKERRLRPKPAATKKDNSNTASSLPQISEEKAHSPDSQFTANEQNVKIKSPIVRLTRCTIPKYVEAASYSSSSSSDEDELPEQNMTSLNDTEEVKELNRALALSKKTYRMEQLKRQAEQRPKEDPQTTALEQPSSLSFFHNNSVACNSTALANNTASTRVMKVKKRTAISTSEQEPKIDEIVQNDSSPPSVIEVESIEEGGEADCTVVTSTTTCEAKKQKLQPLNITKRGILLHRSSTTADSGNFTLTEQELGRVIGERRARKYLKYHMGSRSYDSRHSVYYRPTPKLASALSASPDTAHTLVHELETSSGSCSSEEDIWENIYRYGEVYSILGNSKED
ncbi:uncharacterized protein LOC117896558 isoform X1 [Drosophila subobscura]|uniref:uncharacterized protein LOC117896558 isoform X1 n=1 Tax=Drosophila subobscura TaxID=7241 RepID=UPI00155AE833|nr:uncharacterized protein LOC117896558 isoform X1 [Drosophila subobscura]XP_034660849.1 uncharacterized protein LOC117896558 isoform X1 [Drosophila subobscura]